ncbi:MAG: LacI family DNA-binding transcriptional regulator, partial [Clostridia bacterium]
MNATKLADIAEELGLSVSTVSRALSGNGRVGEDTRKRVLEAVKESAYTPNAVARSLRLRDAMNIGVIVPDIANTYYAAVIKGAQGVCRESGYTLMVCNSDENVVLEEEALHMMLEKQVSGLILAT